MRKNNLIKLGVLAQRMYNLPDDVRIVEYPVEIGATVRVAIPSSLSTFAGYLAPVRFEEVTFEQVGSHLDGEYVWMGYAKEAKVLVFHE